MNINNTCPKCNKHGVTISEIAEKETTISNSSFTGVGLGASLSGVVPAVGSLSG